MTVTALVAGVEAAIWTETIPQFDDLSSCCCLACAVSRKGPE